MVVMSPFLFTTALMIFVSGIPLRGVFFWGGGGGGLWGGVRVWGCVGGGGGGGSLSGSMLK